jgi:3-hydroxyisobutyrate dehydrogenase
MRLGFAGLGRMGAHMATNLVRAGHDVTVWNRSPRAAAEVSSDLGAAVAHSPRALAEGAEVVITMLADDPASDAVHRGADGLFAAVGPRVLLEMGTMSPEHIRALASDAPQGVQVIDAPVSGATQAAADAALMIMLGADRATADRLAPVLGAMGREVIPLGSVGAGSVMKLAINSMIHSLNQTVSEALMLTDAAGIPTADAFDAIEASAACAPMLRYRRDLYLDEAGQAVTFTLDLAAKDMRVTCALADSLGVAMPQAALNLQRLQRASADGFGARDMASLLNHMRGEAQET